MGCRPPCHRPGGWTGRCWPDTPCTGWSPSQCSVPSGRARRMSQTAQSPAHRPGKKRQLHPLRWSPWWSRSLPCHWWTVCSGTRAEETTLVPLHHCMWTLITGLCTRALIQGSNYACTCLWTWMVYPQLPPKGCYMVTATHPLQEACELQWRARAVVVSVQGRLCCKALFVKYLHLGPRLFSERPRWTWRKHFWRWCACRIVSLYFFPMIPPHWYFFD